MSAVSRLCSGWAPVRTTNIQRLQMCSRTIWEPENRGSSHPDTVTDSRELKPGYHQKTRGTTTEPKIIRGQQRTGKTEKCMTQNHRQLFTVPTYLSRLPECTGAHWRPKIKPFKVKCPFVRFFLESKETKLVHCLRFLVCSSSTRVGLRVILSVGLQRFLEELDYKEWPRNFLCLEASFN